MQQRVKPENPRTSPETRVVFSRLHRQYSLRLLPLAAQPRQSSSGPLCLHPALPGLPVLPGAACWTPPSADSRGGSWGTTVFCSAGLLCCGAELSPHVHCSQLLISTTMLFFSDCFCSPCLWLVIPVGERVPPAGSCIADQSH